MRNELEYYHDDVTKTCVVKLDNFRSELWDLADKIEKSFENSVIRFTFDGLSNLIERYPNTYYGKAQFNCGEDDIEKYNVDFGYDLARARLLQKINRVKSDFIYAIFKDLALQNSTIENFAKYYANRSAQYIDKLTEMKELY